MKIHKRCNNFKVHLWLLSPQNMAQYYQNSHQYSSKQKTLFEKFCMIWVFIYRKWTVPKLALLVKLSPISPLKTAEIEKIRSSVEKLQLLSYPNISKSKLYLPSLSGKNIVTFCNIWATFSRKQGMVTSQTGVQGVGEARTKTWQILLYPHNSWSTSCKKSLVPTFSSFVA